MCACFSLRGGTVLTLYSAHSSANTLPGCPRSPQTSKKKKKKASLSAASHPSGESTNNARVKPVTSPRVDELPNKRIPLRPV